MKFVKKELPSNSFLNLIQDRRSIRAFQEKMVERSLIEEILNTARFSPSGVNTQPWHVIVVTGKHIKTIGDSIVAAREAKTPENPDYAYYPTEWIEPYKSRRKKCGLALYSALNIGLEDKELRKAQWYRNYYFFGAPVGLLFFLDSNLKKGAWVDMGMFIQNVMLAANALDLATCPQASLAEYPDIVRSIVHVPKAKALLCGMALGYANVEHPINQYRTEREPISTFSKWLGFDNS